MSDLEKRAVILVFICGVASIVVGFVIGQSNLDCQNQFELGYEQRIIDEREDWKMLDDNLKICQWVEIIKKEGKCK